jgi:hypothetical protein
MFAHVAANKQHAGSGYDFTNRTFKAAEALGVRLVFIQLGIKNGCMCLIGNLYIFLICTENIVKIYKIT